MISRNVQFDVTLEDPTKSSFVLQSIETYQEIKKSILNVPVLKFPRIIFQHQLYAVIINKTQVDMDVMQLRNDKVIRLISCRIQTMCYTCISLMEDYLDAFKNSLLTVSPYDKDNRKYLQLIHKFSSLVQSCSSLSVFIKDIEQLPHQPSFTDRFSRDEIDLILRLGFFTPRRDTLVEDVLWFSLPQINRLVALTVAVRNDVYALLKQAPRNELFETQLLRMLSDNSCLSSGGTTSKKRKTSGSTSVSAAPPATSSFNRRRNGSRRSSSSSSPPVHEVLGWSFHVSDLAGAGIVIVDRQGGVSDGQRVLRLPR